MMDACTITTAEKAHLLTEVRALLTRRGRHSIEAYARLKSGRRCEPLHPHAARWCLFGAFAKVLGIAGLPQDAAALRAYHSLIDAVCCDLEYTRVRIAPTSWPVALEVINDRGMVLRGSRRHVCGRRAVLMLLDETLANYEKDEVAA